MKVSLNLDRFYFGMESNANCWYIIPDKTKLVNTFIALSDKTPLMVSLINEEKYSFKKRADHRVFSERFNTLNVTDRFSIQYLMEADIKVYNDLYVFELLYFIIGDSAIYDLDTFLSTYSVGGHKKAHFQCDYQGFEICIPYEYIRVHDL